MTEFTLKYSKQYWAGWDAAKEDYNTYGFEYVSDQYNYGLQDQSIPYRDGYGKFITNKIYEER